MLVPPLLPDLQGWRVRRRRPRRALGSCWSLLNLHSPGWRSQALVVEQELPRGCPARQGIAACFGGLA